MAYDAGSMEGSFGVRKGSWTDEEDKLLRKCIETYGEGKWHQVPIKAGLNRCRKSCRLRWLNYLRPNIKRGEFKTDEVELMIRLHKLLGNRQEEWSLIAGRLPGRTPNDVKNYWNTHLKRKKEISFKNANAETQLITKTNILKPRPRYFPKTLFWSSAGKPRIPCNVQLGHQNHHHHNSSSPLQAVSDDDNNNHMQSKWWEELLKDPDIDDQPDDGTIDKTTEVTTEEKTTFAHISARETCPRRETEVEEGSSLSSSHEESQSFWSDLSLDADIWNFLNADKETKI